MVKNNFPGKFIAIEGIDGAGKSTQAALMASYFYKNGAKVCLTSEPSQFMLGGLIRARLLGEWQSSPKCLQLLFAADRAEHLEKEILPRLREGINVVSDRYFLSSIAYGAVDCDFDWLAHVNSQFLMPDLTVFLDIDAQTGAERIAANGKSIELFEKTEILEKVCQNYDAAISLFKKDMAIEAI
ncbi:MAG: dTMP kinase, partial [Smithellaceae bacterium]|nr:dTMP kinase [Smithellaceae bacterium]